MTDRRSNITSPLLIPMGGAPVQKQTVENILACNEDTAAFGLTLREEQALALAHTCSDALQENGRVEFGGGIARKMIRGLCSSPYITKENYEDTLHGMIRLFYALKNDTWDRVSDDDLLDFITTSFSGCCRGSLELLAERSDRLASHIRGGGSMDSFRRKGE